MALLGYLLEQKAGSQFGARCGPVTFTRDAALVSRAAVTVCRYTFCCLARTQMSVGSGRGGMCLQA